MADDPATAINDRLRGISPHGQAKILNGGFPASRTREQRPQGDEREEISRLQAGK